MNKFVSAVFDFISTLALVVVGVAALTLITNIGFWMFAEPFITFNRGFNLLVGGLVFVLVGWWFADTAEEIRKPL